MSTYHYVISVTTVLLQQYSTFNIRRLQLSRRRPEAIKGRINVLHLKTVTALLSLDAGSLFSPTSPLVFGAVVRWARLSLTADPQSLFHTPTTVYILNIFIFPHEELTPEVASCCFFHYLPLLVPSACLSASVVQIHLINVSGASALTPLSSQLALLMCSGALNSSKVPQVKYYFFACVCSLWHVIFCFMGHCSQSQLQVIPHKSLNGMFFPRSSTTECRVLLIRIWQESGETFMSFTPRHNAGSFSTSTNSHLGCATVSWFLFSSGHLMQSAGEISPPLLLEDFGETRT